MWWEKTTWSPPSCPLCPSVLSLQGTKDRYLESDLCLNNAETWTDEWPMLPKMFFSSAAWGSYLCPQKVAGGIKSF